MKETSSDAAAPRDPHAPPTSLSGTLGALLTVAVLATAVALMPTQWRTQAAALPDLTTVNDVDERKERFFDYLTPLVNDANEDIRAQRERLLGIERRYEATGGIRLADSWWVQRQRVRYDVDPEADLGEALHTLRRRIDTVPPSLALAQAAIESGWGTSRFALEGNNLFGQWCYREGCGLVPAARPSGARHEVTVFRTVEDAVASYLNNLNVHPAYVPLRELREQARADSRDPSGFELAAGLEQYSERGEPYVREVRTMIRANDLDAREDS